MNVLVLGWEYPPTVAGGLGAACYGLSTALARRGHRILLALPETCRPFALGATADDEISEAHAAGAIERIYLPIEVEGQSAGGETFHPYAVDRAASAEATPKPGWGAAQKLYGADLFASVRAYTKAAIERLAHLEIDAIHAHDWMTYPAALQLRVASRRPVCLHIHSTAFDRGGASAVSTSTSRGTIAGVERAAIRSADAVCAVSSYTESILVKHYGADPSRIHVVHNALIAEPDAADAGVRAAVDRPAAAEPEGDEQTVLFLGRLTKQKGASFLLRAAQLVLAELPGTRFLVAGSGEERSRLIETAAELGLARRVSFLGPISDAAKREAYRAADIFVMPSISEPFGLTPLEALEEGTAVIVTTTSGVAEVLPSVPAVEPGDTKGMAAEILRLLRSAELRQENVTEGRRDARALSWDQSAGDLEAALVLATGRGTSL